MKNLKFITLLLSFLIICSSCEKDDSPNDKKNPPLEIRGAWGLYTDDITQQSDCKEGGIFCVVSVENDLDDNLLLVSNQVAGTGELISSNEKDVMEFNFARNKLDQGYVDQVLETKVVELETFEFDPELVKDLYKQAEVEYDNEPIFIESGAYEVEINKNGNKDFPAVAAMEVEVKITYKDGVTTVTITFSW